jgi:hypothetical protein
MGGKRKGFFGAAVLRIFVWQPLCGLERTKREQGGGKRKEFFGGKQIETNNFLIRYRRKID